jgi:quinol monooxygenase YgiN
MIHVLAVITAKPGRRSEVLEAFRANMPAVHAEAGCLEYGPAVDADDGSGEARFGPDTFVVIEKWESQQALAAHAGSAHMAAYAARTRDMIASRVVHVLQPAAATRPASSGAGSSSLMCPRCGAGPFGTEDELRAHVEAVHANEQ